MRRRACLLLATWLGAGLVALSARDGQSAQPLLVQLPPGTASELTRIVYWTTGPNGGVGAQMDGRRGTDVYPLPTVGASHVKAVIYVPGFELATLDLPIPVPAETAVAINLRRLAAIPFSARIVEPATRTFANLLVRGGFTAVWICSFFNQPDCLQRSFDLPSAALGPDGAFQTEIPDLLHDRTVQAFRPRSALPGESFGFWIEEPTTPPTVWLLRPLTAASTSFDGLAFASEYPVQVPLVATPRR